jgi:hypothetical protein
MPKSDSIKDRLKQAKIDYQSYLLTQYKKGILDDDKIIYLKTQGLLPSQQHKKKAPSRRNQAANKITARGIRTILDPFHFTSNTDLYKPDITDSDWKPDSNLIHSEEFVTWVNSMLYNPITRMDKYLKYEYYKVQAFRWLKDKDTIVDHSTDDAKRQFIYREYERITQNTLYFAEKYGELKEGDISSGLVDYKSKEHQAIIFYMFDCGLNVIGGKGRQIGFTSAMGLAALKKLLIQNNYYIKFITEDKETGEEIFNDKIKYPFGALTSWLQPPVRGDSGNRFWLSDKMKKGDKGYPNSRIDVVAPKKTAINGGSPQLVLIDEIGNIGILGMTRLLGSLF